jgi:glycosyltransferase involved in cell wall biosynthesis
MGLDQLVRAAAILKGQGLRFRVLLGGAGPLADSLQDLVRRAELEEIVFFLGRVPDADLPLCYAAADCFVLPTRALECFGLIVLEAYACGTPVIGTPVGAIPELIGQVGPQWLTDGTDAAAIAQRMRAFLRKELVGDPTGLRTLAEHYRAEIGLERLSRLLLPEACIL